MIKIILIFLVIAVASLEYLSESGLSKSGAAKTDNSSPLVGSQNSSVNLQIPMNDTLPKSSKNTEEVSPAKVSAQSNFPSEQVNKGPGVVLFDFFGSEPGWYTVNDDVMGGISDSSVNVDPQRQRLIFSGNVSLENNGGFASTQSQWAPYNLENFDGIAMRLRGDGNRYQLRIRSEDTGASVAYSAPIETEAGTWQEVFIPFSEMVPLYRGFLVNAAGPLNPAAIRSFGLMVSDKQQGEFSLEVDWINAVATKKNTYTYADSTIVSTLTNI